MFSVLLINTDPVGSFIRKRLLLSENCVLTTVKEEQAFEFLKQHRVDFVFMDLFTSSGKALEFVRKCKESLLDVSHFVVFYATVSEKDKEELLKEGILILMERPLTKEKLQKILKSRSEKAGN